MSNHSLPAGFWSKFHSHHWEKTPAIFKALFDSPFISPGQLFDAIVGMPSRTPSDRFWASRQVPPRTRDDFQPVPLDQHGPRREDQSLDGFFARVRQQIGDLPVGLNIHKLEKSQPELWFQFREFVHGLNTITGELPSGRWDIDTFLGTYKTTPLGIHRDNASVFVMGVMGQRTYYTWPGDYFKPGDTALSTLDTTSIQPHLDNAFRMDLGPGDMVYWPSSNWHFVASDGQPSAVISISAYFGNNLSDVVGDQVKHLIAERLKPNDFNRIYTLNKEPTDTPQQLTTALDIVEETVSNGQVSKALQRLWLTFCSSDGLHPVFPDDCAKLELRDVISVDPRFPIVWKETGGNELLVAANGNTCSIPSIHNTVIISMLKHLNNGRPTVVEQLFEKYSQSDVPADIIDSILNSLQIFRAFKKIHHSEHAN
ncbi:JmjC domain-containing protein [Pseudomonadota bacterium]